MARGIGRCDDDSLGTRHFFEDDAKGYRIWLPQSTHAGFHL